MTYRCANGLAASVGASIVVACGPGRLPAPAWAPQPTSALAEVPYPPPPARVEGVPNEPAAGAVWIDGEWVWQARRYAWKAGRWLVPPPGARFAPWTTVRDARGTLFLASGTWRDARGAAIAEPAPLLLGAPAAGPVITPEGDRLPSGPPASFTPEDRDASRTDADAGTIERLW